GASIVPTLDSIAEFRLLTNSFNAEYGRFSGGIVNVVTKSGTNEVHGSVYEFLRNEKLDARSYFDPERGDFKRNQFGGTIGAPIVKNKVFFFGDYQGTREVRGVSSGVINVPSLLERSGDFGDLGTTGFAQFNQEVQDPNDPNSTIIVPTTVRGDSSATNFAATLSQRLGYQVTPDEAYWFSPTDINPQTHAPYGVPCTSNTQCVFPGANGPVIPQSAWSPVAVKTLNFLPTPTGSSGGTPFFSSAAERQRLRDEKFGIKVDFNTA